MAVKVSSRSAQPLRYVIIRNKRTDKIVKTFIVVLVPYLVKTCYFDVTNKQLKFIYFYRIGLFESNVV